MENSGIREKIGEGLYKGSHRTTHRVPLNYRGWLRHRLEDWNSYLNGYKRRLSFLAADIVNSVSSI